MRLPLLVLFFGAFAFAARAQDGLVVPSLDWRTVETKHFVIHYPKAAEAWTLDFASRIDAEYAAVSAIVGSAPEERVTVLVQDPNNVANGFALPFLNGPVVFFWPTPADPSSGIGAPIGWGGMLAVHEYAHVAHLARPSRNPAEARLARWSTLDFGPLALATPRWATEGYATFVEGRITGAGRPHSAWRAAIIREWARAGQLPAYGQINADPRFFGGAMAYLVGSAYLEWLVARPGQSDSSLAFVWRRMSARTPRGFDEAFSGVFGAPPAELYGRFVAEVTAQSLELERALLADSAKLGAGAPATVQRLHWSTGAPARSPNDSFLALTRGSPTTPTRVVVWPTHVPADTAAARRRAAEMKRDPLDVPAIHPDPPPAPAVAIRWPEGGASFDSPRWLPDGRQLLVIRNTGAGDGEIRRDLFVWDSRTNVVRRVTHEGGIRQADAMPDGRSAVAARCVEGICGLVRVDLASGYLRPIVDGAPRVIYERPRVSPDGRYVAAARQTGAAWRVVLIDLTGAAPMRTVGPDDGANRYDPAWRADGEHLVVVSEAGGVPNLEELDISTNAARPLTRVASAVRAPEPRGRDGTVYFLRLHAFGYDLDRVAADSVPALADVSPLATAAGFAPAATRPPVAADTFAVTPLTPREYGLGPRTMRVLPAYSYGAEGSSVGGMLAGLDPVGKLTWMAQGFFGTAGSWEGGSAGAAWRGFPVVLRAELFSSRDDPSHQWGFAAPATLDATMSGGVLSAGYHRAHVTNEQQFTAGVSLASFTQAGATGPRWVGFASWDGTFLATIKTVTTSARISLTGAAGRTDGEEWSRGTVALTLAASRGPMGLELSGSYGHADHASPAFELFAIGGTPPPFFETALYGQRIVMPALPAGLTTGNKMATVAAALPILGVRPYFWAGTTAASLNDWQEVAGLESGIATDGIWFARLPGLRVLGGAGYAMNGVWKYKTRVYLSVTFRP